MSAFFAGNAYTKCGADEADEGVSGGDDEAEDDALGEGEAGWGGFFCERRGCADFAHDAIVTGRRSEAKVLRILQYLIAAAEMLRHLSEPSLVCSISRKTVMQSAVLSSEGR